MKRLSGMLFSETSGKKITAKVRVADTSFKRFKGLMLERGKNFDYALVFLLPRETRAGASLHMLFVFFPIDVLFLDAGKKVVDKATLHPWALNYTPKKAAKFIVELPAGKASQVKLGEKIGWKIKGQKI